jgi:hypothetical protein
MVLRAAMASFADAGQTEIYCFVKKQIVLDFWVFSGFLHYFSSLRQIQLILLFHEFIIIYHLDVLITMVAARCYTERDVIICREKKEKCLPVQ